MTENSPLRPGVVRRWRLAEPVRFYLWPVFAVECRDTALRVARGELIP